jgi:hypothetical protein
MHFVQWSSVYNLLEALHSVLIISPLIASPMRILSSFFSTRLQLPRRSHFSNMRQRATNSLRCCGLVPLLLRDGFLTPIFNFRMVPLEREGQQ